MRAVRIHQARTEKRPQDQKLRIEDLRQWTKQESAQRLIQNYTATSRWYTAIDSNDGWVG